MKRILKDNRGSLLVSGGAVLGLLMLALWLVATPAYNGIRQDAEYSADLANARMIVSATAAHNALSEANDEDDAIITYDMLMDFSDLEEFNNASEIDIYSLSDDDFYTAIAYISEDENGELIIDDY